MSGDVDLAPELIFSPDVVAPAPERLAPSPRNFEFTGEESLRVTVTNSLGGVIVAVAYRFITREGNIIANTQTMIPASDRTSTSTEFALGNGYLLNLTVYAATGSPRRGQTFVRVQIIRGRDTSATVLGSIVQGYVTGNQDRAWPGSPLEGALEGDGYWRLVVGTTPAPGAEVFETVPTGARWELCGLETQLTSNAAAVTRIPNFVVASNAGFHVRVPPAGTSPANELRYYHWYAGLARVLSADADIIVSDLPAALILLAGHTLGTATSNLQAGDSFSAPRFIVREWLEVP